MLQNFLTVVYTIYQGRLLIENSWDFSQKSNLKSQLCRLEFVKLRMYKPSFCHQVRRLLKLLMLSNAIHVHPM